MSRWIALTILGITVCLVLGTISILGELQAGAAAASQSHLMSYRGRWGLPQPAVALKAELVGEGREILLVPTAREIVVVKGNSVVPLAPACDYQDGQFLLSWTGERVLRVWLFAVVADHKPQVKVVSAPIN